MSEKRAQFTLRLDQETNLKIKKIAEKEGRSAANMIEFFLKRDIAQYEKKNGRIKISDKMTERS